MERRHNVLNANKAKVSFHTLTVMRLTPNASLGATITANTGDDPHNQHLFHSARDAPYLCVGEKEELLLAERERRKSPVAILVVVLLEPLAVGAQARLQTAVVGDVLSLRRLAVQL